MRIETRFASTDGAIANVFEFLSFYFSVTLLLGLLDLSDYCGGYTIQGDFALKTDLRSGFAFSGSRFVFIGSLS